MLEYQSWVVDLLLYNYGNYQGEQSGFYYQGPHKTGSMGSWEPINFQSCIRSCMVLVHQCQFFSLWEPILENYL